MSFQPQLYLSYLGSYTACDIADALLKLKVPNAGFLPDLKLITSSTSPQGITIARASTVLFVAKSPPTENHPELSEANIPEGKHYVDLTVPDSIVIMSQPEGQKCAILGGIMASRMRILRAKGVVAIGRVRDVKELEETGLTIWAKGISIVGVGAESKPHAIQVPLSVDGTIITPGDIVFSDPINGVAIIPQDKVEDVLALLPKLVEADDRVKEEVEKGMTVQEAFKIYRG